MVELKTDQNLKFGASQRCLDFGIGQRINSGVGVAGAALAGYLFTDVIGQSGLSSIDKGRAAS